MLIGGYNWYREDGRRFDSIYNETKLVALEPEQNPVPECLKKLRDFPFDTSEMHGGTDAGIVPLVSPFRLPLFSIFSQMGFHSCVRVIEWMKRAAL